MFSVRSPFGQIALTVRSLFTHCSSGKVERFRVCTGLLKISWKSNRNSRYRAMKLKVTLVLLVQLWVTIFPVVLHCIFTPYVSVKRQIRKIVCFIKLSNNYAILVTQAAQNFTEYVKSQIRLFFPK